ncbi:Mms22p KNAG_0C05910 [Huiozyma naganishii CBS 8797]|uniref:Uncharacterized protein n=1 Tax=Huiozyma naganishii (strain ATCC MYA-139 / BCRC 22969 / CBS 8797 / KCTC 17520 / NBRC 10181 / NCYC 3082 / Yp74L-3) TaxID=1071383 RepID=J7S563_HUIN7|nr:hypothetical protein KNAG_0C05910 [Kazachstania naganishii CBS 8797]CCK69689.1 hypothetical protein KNAG_0C05910 [Kazachstania naganishii CBS 8797]
MDWENVWELTAPDSQTDDEHETVIHDFSWELEHTSGGEPAVLFSDVGGNISTTEDRHVSEDEVTPDNMDIDQDVSADPIEAGSRLRWSLRKRTAIQKLPYSLDRIKHKQLLEGFDVSAFDSVSNQVELPRTEPLRQYSANDYYTDDSYSMDSSLIDEEHDGSNEHGDFTPNLAVGVDSEDDIDESAQLNDTSENDDEIIFRGRKISVKRGYKGILPKMAWQKELSMKSGSTIKARNIHHLPSSKKGIGTKKKRHIINPQDHSLMNEMIVADDETKDLDNFVYNVGLFEKNKIMENEAEKANDYFKERYNEGYLSGNSANSDLVVLGETETGIKNNDASRNKYSPPHKSNFNNFDAEQKYQGRTQLYPSSDEEVNVLERLGSAPEENRGLIDYMLDRTKKNNSTHPKTNANRQDRRLSKITKAVKGKLFGSKARRSTQYASRNTPAKAVQIYRKRIFRPAEGPATTPVVELVRADTGIFEKSKSKSRKPTQYASNRNTRTYNTVVEALGERFGATSRKITREASELDRAMDEPLLEPEGMVILKKIVDKTKFDPPDTITIKLLDKVFTLSRLNRNDIGPELERVFSFIIERGATDNELKDMCESLSQFMFLLDISVLREIIEKFHSEFRAKVNQLRDKAKPIHFYVIAVLLLILLEISRYSTVTASLRSSMEVTIFDHVTSFYRFLSICYKTVLRGDRDLLRRCYRTLQIVVGELGGADKLWDFLEKQTFSPRICLSLVKTYPSNVSRWSVMRLSQKYDDMVWGMKFVKYCSQVLRWEIDDALILKFDQIFKKRRYADFHEEQSLDSIPSKSHAELPVVCTVFAKYLVLLKNKDLSASFMERITPLGEISKNNPISVIVNRFSILVVLASKSRLNFERRFDIMVTQIISDNVVGGWPTSFLERTVKSILETTISLFLNNIEKNFHFKAKVLPLVYTGLVRGNPTVTSIWFGFLQKISLTLHLAGNKNNDFLKELHKCFISMLGEEDQFQASKCLSKIFLNNLDTLGTEWVQSSLFQTVKQKAQTSVQWVDDYWTICSFLVEKNVFSWWLLSMYNGLDKVDEVKFYFYSKLLGACDEDCYINIKESMFRLLVNQLFDENAETFYKFVEQLLRRECGLMFETCRNEVKSNPLPILKRIYKVLETSGYEDLVLLLFSKTELQFRNAIFSQADMLSLIKFLNKHLFDILKKSEQFIYLQNEFGISEMDKDLNGFREHVNSLESTREKVSYFEQVFISVGDVNAVVSLLVSLVDSSGIRDLYEIFFYLILGHCQKSTDSEAMSRAKLYFVSVYLTAINVGNGLKSYQLNEEQLASLFKIHRFICYYWRIPDYPDTGLKAMEECLIFQYRMLCASSGFSENKHLVEYSKIFLDQYRKPTVDTVIDELQEEISSTIEDILLKNLDHVSKYPLEESNRKLTLKLMDKVSKFTNIFIDC